MLLVHTIQVQHWSLSLPVATLDVNHSQWYHSAGLSRKAAIDSIKRKGRTLRAPGTYYSQTYRASKDLSFDIIQRVTQCIHIYVLGEQPVRPQRSFTHSPGSASGSVICCSGVQSFYNSFRFFLASVIGER